MKDKKAAPTITPAAPRPARPVQNDTAPVIPERKRAAPADKRIKLYHPAYHRQKGVDKNGNSGCQTKERGETMKLRHLFFRLFRRVRDDVLPAPFGGDCLLG